MKLNRRQLLQTTWAGFALPHFESLGSFLRDESMPQRLVYVYVPNGIDMPRWRPDTEGADAPLPEVLPSSLKPLSEWRSAFSIYSGLTLDEARSNGDGPGDHARAAAAFLTCAQPLKADGTRLAVGVSADQVAARHLGDATRIPSLQLACEGAMRSGQCDSGYPCAYSSHISWATPHTPLSAETNPRLLFDRLFGAGLSHLEPEEQARQLRRKRSVLDLMRRQVREIEGQLGQSDRRKLEEYLEGVRELERRLEYLTDPVAVAMERPTGTPDKYADHAALLFELLHLALATDSTRVATFMLANEGSNKNYRNLKVSGGHHEISHHGDDPKKREHIARINRFHLELFGGFLKRLSESREGEEPLLDRTLVVYGSGISDGNSHRHHDLPILLAGGGQRLAHGRHRRFEDETSLAQFHGALLRQLGVPEEGLAARRFLDSERTLEL